jgi:phosphoribosylformimino-5-aminoimidazole carboxamide ribotide isomerase
LKDFLIPAIDLKEGRLVRLYRGQEDQAKVYSEKPEEVARFFEMLGFSRLHVVDLDGAFGGVPRNLQAIRNIRKVFSGTIQVGGGLRSMETLKILDEEGINLFVVGTVALKNPQLFEEMLRAFPGRLVLSVDSKGGKVSVGGWKEESPYTPQDLVKVWDQKPIWGYLYTVVEKDGTLEGVDPKPYEEFKRVSKKPLLASGGVASLQDLKKLYGLVEGVVVGKAIYEGKIDLRELK